MSEALANLFQCREVKSFVKQFKELEKEWETPAAFVRQAAPYLAPRLYQPYYDEDTPHGLFGLASALNAASLYPEEQRWWPFVQQAWHLANHRHRVPLPYAEIPAAGEGSADARWEALDSALQEHNFSAAFGLARGMLEKFPDALKQRLALRAYDDSAQGGLEFLLTSQYLHLAELGEGDSGHAVLAALIHFVALSPRDCNLASEVKASARGVRPAGAKGALQSSDYRQLEQKLLFGDSLQGALAAAADAASKAGLDALWDGLHLAGVNAVCNARSGHWVRPARALLTGYLGRRRLQDDAETQTRAALQAAALLQRASASTRHGGANRDLEEVARRLCPLDVVNTLRSVVSHSDPMASATAIYALLGMGEKKHPEIFQNLATLAAKNDGRMGRGYDLLIVRACVDGFQESQLEEKPRYLSGCAYFLGRLTKDYELFGAYGT